MFNITGTQYGRFGEIDKDVVDLSFTDMRHNLVKLLFYTQIDNARSKKAIPGAYVFEQEEGEYVVVPTTDEAKAQLKDFVEQLNANGCKFFHNEDSDNDDDITWVGGDKLEERDFSLLN